MVNQNTALKDVDCDTTIADNLPTSKRLSRRHNHEQPQSEGVIIAATGSMSKCRERYVVIGGIISQRERPMLRHGDSHARFLRETCTKDFVISAPPEWLLARLKAYNLLV